MGFESWGIVEIMGHKIYAGKLSEQEIAGTAMLRVDVPKIDDIPEYTKLFGAAAIYAITPTDETGARMAATKLRERPISPYVLPMLAASIPTVEVRSSHWDPDDENEDIDDGDEDWDGEDGLEESTSHDFKPSDVPF